MTLTLRKLRGTMEEQKVHQIREGRKAHYCVPDQIGQAMKLMQMNREVQQVNDDAEIEADDLMDD